MLAVAMPSRRNQTNDRADWILGLPEGPDCSIGYSSNEAMSFEGPMSSGRENEDRHYTCIYQDKTQLYMVLDGHDGTKAVKFALKQIPHILLGSQLAGGDQQVIKALRNAIVNTEREFFISIDPYITRKVTLQMEIEQKAVDSSTALKLFPTQINEIGRLDELIKGGTTAVVALIHENRLYVANIGDSRALLCLEGKDDRLTIEQLSVDHNTSNTDELRRLERCGLDPNMLRRNSRLGMQQNTRSIGDYSIKGGYKNVDIISHATSEPGTAEPYIHEPISLSGVAGFLILMSDGLYEAYEAWTGRPERINDDIGYLVAKELKGSSDLKMVAQNVVNKVKILYRDTCKRDRRSGRLDDITLIVKNFGYPSSLYQHLPSSAPVFSGQFDFRTKELSYSGSPAHPSQGSSEYRQGYRHHRGYSQEAYGSPYHEPRRVGQDQQEYGGKDYSQTWSSYRYPPHPHPQSSHYQQGYYDRPPPSHQPGGYQHDPYHHHHYQPHPHPQQQQQQPHPHYYGEGGGHMQQRPPPPSSSSSGVPSYYSSQSAVPMHYSRSDENLRQLAMRRDISDPHMLRYMEPGMMTPEMEMNPALISAGHTRTQSEDRTTTASPKPWQEQYPPGRSVTDLPKTEHAAGRPKFDQPPFESERPPVIPPRTNAPPQQTTPSYSSVSSSSSIGQPVPPPVEQPVVEQTDTKQPDTMSAPSSEEDMYFWNEEQSTLPTQKAVAPAEGNNEEEEEEEGPQTLTSMAEAEDENGQGYLVVPGGDDVEPSSPESEPEEVTGQDGTKIITLRTYAKFNENFPPDLDWFEMYKYINSNA